MDPEENVVDAENPTQEPEDSRPATDQPEDNSQETDKSKKKKPKQKKSNEKSQKSDQGEKSTARKSANLLGKMSIGKSKKKDSKIDVVSKDTIEKQQDPVIVEESEEPGTSAIEPVKSVTIEEQITSKSPASSADKLHDLSNSDHSLDNTKKNKACKECKRPFTPDLSLKSCGSSKSQASLNLASKSCTSILSKRSFGGQLSSIDQFKCPSQRQLPQHTSKTCINCGKRYRDDNMSVNATAMRSNCSIHQNVKPHSQSCKSSMTNSASVKYSRPSSTNNRSDYYKSDRNQEFPTRSRSKCSQLSHTQSTKSFAPCQSFDECSTCKRFIFNAVPSCKSFDVCNDCKRSVNNCSQSANYSRSRDLKDRSVNFSVIDDDISIVKSISGATEEIIENIDISRNSSYCGCHSTMSCKDPCETDKPDESCGNEEDECDAIKRKLKELETFVPKEPSQLSLAKSMLQDRMSACQVAQESEKKKSLVKRQIDPTKPRLHRTRKLNEKPDDYECPSNPCCISEEKRERYQKVTDKLIQREGKRQADIKTKKYDRLMKMLSEKCGDDECQTDAACKTDTKCGEADDDCIEYSKKYQKMKYEIEMQNYLVEKLNRDLEMKISRNFPNAALIDHRHDLDKEVIKLREMVEFTMFEQCRNRDLIWGTIPVSTVLSHRSAAVSKKTRCMPRTPSGISNISAFSLYEDLKLCQEKEKRELEIEMDMNRQNHIEEMIENIQVLECTITQLKCDQDELTESIENLHACDSECSSTFAKIQELEDIKCKMERIVSEIQATKSDIDLMHTKLHMINNPA